MFLIIIIGLIGFGLYELATIDKPKKLLNDW